MKEPNIFNYATREFSQDAVVCWLFACLHSTDAVCREIGVNFLRFILNQDDLNDKDVSIETQSPHHQYYHMDVYTVVKIKDKIYPIIVENKTNTYLRSNQLQKYCVTVADWMHDDVRYLDGFWEMFKDNELVWGELVYIFFKTGYASGWQNLDFSNQIKHGKGKADRKGSNTEK